MDRVRMVNRRALGRWAGIKMFQVATLCLLLGMALPARAADERAVKTRVEPIYPALAKRMRIGGMVKMVVTVNAQGKVTDAKTLSGNQMLATAAEDAVRQWKYEPGSGDASVNVDINFTVGP